MKNTHGLSLDLYKSDNLFSPVYPKRRIFSNIKCYFKNLKYWIQRGRYGVSELDSWDLDSYLLTVIENGLILLKDAGNSHPMWCTYEEWQNKLSEMIKLSHEAHTDTYEYTLDAWDDYIDAQAKYGDDSEECKKYRDIWLEQEQKYDKLKADSTHKLLRELDKYFYDLWD